MSKTNDVDFHGWVIATDTGALLRVVANPQVTEARCDQCGREARYALVLNGEHQAVCQTCLQESFEDPSSPDEFYVPTMRRSYVTTYSDGGQQITVTIRQR